MKRGGNGQLIQFKVTIRLYSPTCQISLEVLHFTLTGTVNSPAFLPDKSTTA